MRIFVAIKILESLGREILEWEKQNPEFSGLENKIRRTAAKNLHITLVPPWETGNWQAISRQLKTAAAKPFVTEFNRVSCGPDPKLPRLIWASGSAAPGITELRGKIYEALGQPAEARPFRLHITLARFRREDAHSLPGAGKDLPVGWRQEVKSFVLFRSHLSPQGSDYEVLEEYGLDEK